jgi:hypothetical protein
MNLSGGAIAIGQGELVSSSTQLHNLGQLAQTSDGRKWRYCKAGASDLVAGNVIQAPAQIANHRNLTVAAHAIGVTTLTVTLGATAATADQYAGGVAIVSTTPGLGYSYGISGHPAADASASLALSLHPSNSIQVALTSSSKIDLQVNPYRGVIQAPVTTLTGAVVGVATYIITAAQFGWLCTGGHCGVLIDGTPAVGVCVSSPAAAAGAAAVNSGTLQILGVMMATGVDTRVMAVKLSLD